MRVVACWGHGSHRCPLVSAADRARLEAIVADRNRAQKHVARARIILASAARSSVAEVARRAGVGRPVVWRWQRRFAEAGVDGLLREASRKPGKAPLGDATVQRVVALTRAEPPGKVASWTAGRWPGRSGSPCAQSNGSSRHTNCRPHRIRTFKRSTIPTSPQASRSVGLYMAPPRRALVLSIDEKSQSRRSIAPSRPAATTGRSQQHGTTTSATAPRRSLLPSMFLRAPSSAAAWPATGTQSSSAF